MLILLGFGSCCNRPMKKSKADLDEIKVDSTAILPIIRVMYGSPTRDYRQIGEPVVQQNEEQVAPEKATDAE